MYRLHTHFKCKTKVLYVVIHADVVGIVKNIIFMFEHISTLILNLNVFAKLDKNWTNCKIRH